MSSVNLMVSCSQFDSHADGLTRAEAHNGGRRVAKSNLARTLAEAGGRPDPI